MEVVSASLWTALILFVLFDTNAVYHYVRIMPFVNRMTRMKEYSSRPPYELQLSYSEFMQSYHPSFLVELFSCRYCMGVWISTAATGVVGDWEWLPAIFFASQAFQAGFKALDRMLSEAGEKS